MDGTVHTDNNGQYEETERNREFSVSVHITFTKIIAAVILGLGMWLSLELESVTPFSVAVPASSALVLGKQAKDVYYKKYKTKSDVKDSS